MSRLPTITFIEGDPPAENKRANKLMTGWVAYVLARLEDRPGVWAKVDAEHANTANVKITCKKAGFDVDVAQRANTLYMRLNR